MNENKVETGSQDATYFCEKVCENKVESGINPYDVDIEQGRL